MISPTHIEGTNTVSKSIPSSGEDDFDALVLQYLTVNHPKDNLNIILKKLKALAPNTPLTLAALSKAMNVAHAKMREDSAHAEYANTVLCKKAMQLTGTNMFYTTMMINMFFPTYEEHTVIEKF